MTAFLVILAILLWCLSIWCLYGRQTVAPALSYLAMVSVSFISRDGYSLLPLNTTILTGWLCLTLVVMFASMLQPDPVRRQTRGMTYLIGGGIAGLAVGLLAFSFCHSISLRYACMVLGTVIGIALAFCLYALTPEGRPIKIGSANFFRYLLAKGFPTAISLAMIGIVLVLVIALQNVNAL